MANLMVPWMMLRVGHVNYAPYVQMIRGGHIADSNIQHWVTIVWFKAPTPGLQPLSVLHLSVAS